MKYILSIFLALFCCCPVFAQSEDYLQQIQNLDKQIASLRNGIEELRTMELDTSTPRILLDEMSYYNLDSPPDLSNMGENLKAAIIRQFQQRLNELIAERNRISGLYQEQIKKETDAKNALEQKRKLEEKRKNQLKQLEEKKKRTAEEEARLKAKRERDAEIERKKQEARDAARAAAEERRKQKYDIALAQAQQSAAKGLEKRMARADLADKVAANAGTRLQEIQAENLGNVELGAPNLRPDIEIPKEEISDLSSLFTDESDEKKDGENEDGLTEEEQLALDKDLALIELDALKEDLEEENKEEEVKKEEKHKTLEELEKEWGIN